MTLDTSLVRYSRRDSGLPKCSTSGYPSKSHESFVLPWLSIRGCRKRSKIPPESVGPRELFHKLCLIFSAGSPDGDIGGNPHDRRRRKRSEIVFSKVDKQWNINHSNSQQNLLVNTLILFSPSPSHLSHSLFLCSPYPTAPSELCASKMASAPSALLQVSVPSASIEVAC